ACADRYAFCRQCLHEDFPTNPDSSRIVACGPLIVDVPATSAYRRRNDSEIVAESFCQALGDCLSPRDEGVDLFQLRQSYGGLNFRHPKIETDDVHKVAVGELLHD